MAPGTGCTTTLSGGGECSMEDQDQNDDTVGNLNQAVGKPPRDHSAMRHCSSSSWLADSVIV